MLAWTTWLLVACSPDATPNDAPRPAAATGPLQAPSPATPEALESPEGDPGGPTPCPPAPPSTAPITFSVARTLTYPGAGWRAQAGRFLDDNQDGVIDGADGQQLWVQTELGHTLFDAQDQPVRSVMEDAYLSAAVVADVLPAAPGAEYVGLHYAVSATSQLLVSQPIWDRLTGMDHGEASAEPWVTDLERDGVPEVLTLFSVRDATTGMRLAHLDGLTYDGSGGARPVSADLDLDGIEEIVAHHPTSGVQYFDPGGTVLATCWPPNGNWPYASFAIGDLDGDPEGEVVAAGRNFVVVCDSDGSLLASATIAADQPAMVGLGELDGDALPEIVIGDVVGLIALDTDLTQLFYRGNPPQWEWYPFSLADLDGDGYHEILFAEGSFPSTTLYALAGDGSVRGSIAVPQKGGWMDQPIVADLDGDGLAEIAFAGIDETVVLDDGVNGGWSVLESDHPWNGPNRFPGDRDLMGAVPPAAAPHWSTWDRNVWQGLPTVAHPADCERPPR